MSDEALEALERAEYLHAMEGPAYIWAHGVDQWMTHDLPKIKHTLLAARAEADELREMLDKLHLAHVQRLREIDRLAEALRGAMEIVDEYIADKEDHTRGASAGALAIQQAAREALREVGEEKE